MFGRINTGRWQREAFPELLLRVGGQREHSQLELRDVGHQHGTLVLNEGCVSAALITPMGVGGLAALRTFLGWPEGRYTLVAPPIPALPRYAALERRPLREQLRQAAQDAEVRIFARPAYTPSTQGVARAPFEAEVRSRLLRVFGPISTPIVNELLHDTLGDARWVSLGQVQSLLEGLRGDLPEDLHPLLEAQGVALLHWMEQGA